MLSFPFSDFLPLLGPQIFINSNLVFEALHGANAKSHPLTLWDLVPAVFKILRKVYGMDQEFSIGKYPK